MDTNPRVCVEIRLFPGRAHATNKARTCQDCKGLSLMSDKHNQQRKSATAFHFLANTLTARLVQTSRYKSLSLSHHSNSEGGKRQGGEDTRTGPEELGWSVRTKHHNETDSWPEPLQLCSAWIPGSCTSGQAWQEHALQPGLRSVLPHSRDTLQLSIFSAPAPNEKVEHTLPAQPWCNNSVELYNPVVTKGSLSQCASEMMAREHQRFRMHGCSGTAGRSHISLWLVPGLCHQLALWHL